MTMRIHVLLPGLAGLALTAPALAVDYGLNALDSALTGGEPSVDMRYRYEAADDSVSDEASASTLRTRIGYETGDYAGFTIFGEMEDVSEIGSNRRAPVDPDYATIMDVPDTVLNRAQLDYRGITGLHLTVGRQRIVFDNARHVGDVAWRQNNQTLDAARVRYDIFGISLDYAYASKVNAINPAADHHVGHHLFQAGFDPIDALSLGYYALFLDRDDIERESATHGVVAKGRPRSGALRWSYRLEYARQNLEVEQADNDTSYVLARVGLEGGAGNIALAHEVLGSDGGEAGFQTDLATKHAFNGWADVFLATPDQGLRDTRLELGTELADINLAFRYHRFASDRGGIDYGDELNLQLTRSWGKYTLGAKMARFTADELDQVIADADDTDRYWLWASLSF